MSNTDVFEGPIDLIEWNRYELWPSIKSFSRLAHCVSGKKGHKFQIEFELRKLVNSGILSVSSFGNFRMMSSLHPDFFIGLKIGDDRLYFTTEGEARNVAKRFSLGGLSVISNSDYVLPNTISAAEWHVVRRKLAIGSAFERGYIKHTLIERELVAEFPVKDTNIKVFYQPSSRKSRKYIGLSQGSSTQEENRLYFLKREDAKAYASIFPFRTVIE